MGALELDATQAAGSDARPDGDDDGIAPGDLIGEYVVENRLGAGAFGAVYRAQHPVLGRDVAIKILHRGVSSNDEVVGRFLAEARAVNQIRHRNIIDIFGFGKLTDGRHYYVMECLEGAPLDVVLAERGRLPPWEALPLLREIAKALDAAHDQGIIHRDLKAENVFLVRTGEETYPKLLDFGIAKLITSGDRAQARTQSGIQVGTPYAMAPEQCRGVAVDGRTDVYALGVLAHRLLTGTHLFDGETAMDVIMKHMAAKPPPMSRVVRELPPALDKPVLKMLAKDPNDRFARASEAVAALTECAQRLGLDAPSPSAVRRGLAGAPLSADAPATLRSSVVASVRRQPPWLVPAVALAATVALVAAWLHERAVPLRSEPTPAAVPPAPPRDLPSPEAVDVRVSVSPPTATVFVDEREVGRGVASFSVTRGQRFRVTAREEGHLVRDEWFVADAALRLEWVLERVEERPPSKSRAQPASPAANPRPARRERRVHSDLINPID